MAYRTKLYTERALLRIRASRSKRVLPNYNVSKEIAQNRYVGIERVIAVLDVV